MPRCYKGRCRDVPAEKGFPIRLFFYAHLQFASLLRDRLSLPSEPDLQRAYVSRSAGYKYKMFHDVPMLAKDPEGNPGDEMHGVVFDVQNPREYDDVREYVRSRYYSMVSVPVMISDPMYEGENPSVAKTFVWGRQNQSPLRDGTFDIQRFYELLEMLRNQGVGT